jgi:hypothetical protein
MIKTATLTDVEICGHMKRDIAQEHADRFMLARRLMKARRNIGMERLFIDLDVQYVEPVPVDASTSIYVEEGDYCLVRGADAEKRYLVTSDLYTCVAVMASDPKTRTGFLAHAIHGWHALEAMDIAQGEVGGMISVVYGCMSKSETVNTVEEYEHRNEGSIEIIGRGVNDHNWRLYTPRDAGVDIQTGRVIIPEWVEDVELSPV